MRVLVCGGRAYNNKAHVYSVLNLHKDDIKTIVHGGANGADSLAGQWALENGKEVEVYPANWELYGKAAGPKRNAEMAETKPNIVIAFPGGKGTLNMIAEARVRNIPVADYRKGG